jgi:hypothetical protein
MIELHDHMEGASLPELIVPTCLDGQLVAAMEAAQRRVAAAEEQATSRSLMLGDARQGELTAAQQALDTATSAVRAKALPFRLQAMPRKDWPAFKAAHKARKNNQDDLALGWNSDTFQTEILKACLVDPQVSDEPFESNNITYTSQWDWLEQHLSNGQWEQLIVGALRVNGTPIDVPFSSASSEQTPGSDGT